MPSALQVWLPLPVPAFDFLAPHDGPGDLGDGAATAALPVGARIAVPWQGGVRVGVVAAAREVGAAAALDLHPAVAWVDARAWLGAATLATLAAQAARCAVPVGVALVGSGAIGLRGPFRHQVRRDEGTPPELLAPEGDALADGAWHDADDVPWTALTAWRTHGLVHERVRPVRPTQRRLVAVRRGDVALDGAARAAQRRALAWLEEEGGADSAAALARDASVPEGAARALVAKGYAAYVDVEAPPPPPPWALPADAPSPFASARVASPAAAAAPTPIATPPAAADLLVTGGAGGDRFDLVRKLVQRDVAAGGQALWLVPEQATAEAVASALAAGPPTLRWPADGDEPARQALADEVARGTPLVVVGTYPSLTLPFAALARVVVWDAASSSYKGMAGARSVARADARVLATAAGATLTVVDPLATVELEAEHRAADGDRGIGRVALPRARPRTALIDLRQERGWPLTAPLVRLLRQVAARERQALLLVPRRGFAAALGCRDCGEVVMCPNCDLPMRWHARVARLRCHQCGAEQGPPTACPACGSEDLVPRPGAGTEWVAQVARAAVPELPVLQWDRDRRDDPAALVAGRPGVLVGTTSALRAPPLPELALIALTAGDALLDREDVRATESALRTLLLLPDLAVGPRRPLLVAQVYRPEHEVWQAWTAADLDGGVARVLEGVGARRAAFGYPPQRRWARVQVTHRDRGQAGAAAQALIDRLKAAGVPADDVLGPAPAPLARAQGRYAFHAFVRADDDATLAERVGRIDARPAPGAKVRVDVDPYDMEAWLD